jgi:large subunit ribosomal protein L15
MQIHQLKANHPGRKSQRVGRGGKRGTTAGRGTKGQKARAGHKIRPAEREILKKIPKLRGSKFKSFRPGPAVVNLSLLDKKFKAGEEISPQTLLARGLISRIKGQTPKVKILGGGELSKKLIFKEVEFSRSAAAKLKT